MKLQELEKLRVLEELQGLKLSFYLYYILYIINEKYYLIYRFARYKMINKSKVVSLLILHS